jgi:hypothetical protein
MGTDVDTKQCATCGEPFTQEQSSGKHCFRCKIRSVGFTWRGPTRASKQNFHDHTIGEVVRESVRQEKASGTHAEMDFVGSRWV